MRQLLRAIGIVALVAITGSVVGQDRSVEPGKTVYLKGTVVRVDPKTNTVVLRLEDGGKTRDAEYQVNPATKYWGPDRQSIKEGLSHQSLKEGLPIWYHLSPGTDPRYLSEMWLGAQPSPGPGTDIRK